MGEYTDLIQTISLTLGVAWASGINLYAAVAMLGVFYAAVRSWTGRVVPAIVAHALTNAVALVGLFATAPS